MRPTRRITAAVSIGITTAVLLATAGCSSGLSGTPTDPNQEIPVAFGLKRDQSGLATAVADRSTPSSATYLQWLDQQSLQSQFGAPSENVSTVLEVIEKAGFTGAVDGSGAILVGSMTPPEIETLFGEQMVDVVQGSATVAQPARPVRVPDSLTHYVQDIAGLTFQVAESAPSEAPESSSDPQCPPESDLAKRLNSFYGLDPIAKTGKGGEGMRIAMLEIDQYSAKALSLYGKCHKTQLPPVTNHEVDKSPAAVFGPVAEETTLDIVAASTMAPRLSGIDTYQFNPYSPVVFPLAAAVDASYAPDGPQFISSSVGFCESDVNEAAMSISEWLLMSAAVTGVTTVAAAGDDGSSACAPSDKALAAQYPASSPNAVGIGGTEFTNDDFTAANEVVWNATPGSQQAGGGTTASTLARPAYQSGLSFDGGRLVPDTSLIASPNEFGPIPVCTPSGSCVMQLVGGTSASAPAFTAALAVTLNAINSGASGSGSGSDAGSTTASISRLGQLNPTLYQLAADASTSPFSDVTQGTNDLYSAGCCTAAPGYDPASGWGSVAFDKLAAGYQTLISQSRATD